MWMYLALILVLTNLAGLIVIVLNGFKQSINVVKSKLLRKKKSAWVEKWWKTGVREIYFEPNLGSTIEFEYVDEFGNKKKDVCKVTPIKSLDEETRIPVVVAIQGVIQTINPSEEYKPEALTKILNEAIIESYEAGLHEAERQMKQNYTKVFFVGAIIVGVLVIVSAYFAWQNNEILLKFAQQAKPFIEAGNQALANGVISTTPKP